MTNTDHLKTLGDTETDYKFNGPHVELLEAFPSPLMPYGAIQIAVPEFTSLCPKTGQPDFATIYISYAPSDTCVESKSLKLYLMSFRNVGEFHESCVQRIYNDLFDLLHPDELFVQGQFTPRGGIPFWPECGTRHVVENIL